MTFTIYALFDEREPDRVRYVGFSRNPEGRWRRHLDESKRVGIRSHRLHWIRKVTSERARVLWRTLSVVGTADEAAAAEIAAIREHLEAGHPLTNGTEGGEGVQGFGGVLSPEAAARRNETINSPEWLAKRSVLSARYWATGETREQHRKVMEDFWESPEGEALRERNSAFARAQMLDPNYRGGPRTMEARDKMRLAKIGKPHAKARTAEWNEKIGAAQRGVKRGAWSEERKAAHAARLNDPATKAKMSASAKARPRETRKGCTKAPLG